MTKLTIRAMGGLIGAALDEDGISQAEFARLTGCSAKHVNQVVNGNGTATTSMLDYWAYILGRQWTVNLTPTQPPTPPPEGRQQQ
jgi:transcriptional regulator with XRE-family HTH domain